jgi:preprotein translocase subunit SecG
MNVLGIILLVIFIIVAILLVLIVLAQTSEGDSLGGIFSGGANSAFGSRTGNILTRATAVLGGAFLVLSLALALVNRTQAGQGVIQAGQESSAAQTSDWWQGGDAPADTTGEAD